MSPSAIARMLSEKEGLEGNPDYKVFFKDDTLLDFVVYIPGPEDSLYRYKLLKFQFQIPEKYPVDSPRVTFIQSAPGRVHPILEREGHVRLSILGNGPGGWHSGLSIHAVLSTIHSLLDNKPYCHEPAGKGKNDPDYNKYVQFIGWRALLTDHIIHETDARAQVFIKRFVRHRSDWIMEEVLAEKEASKNVPCFIDPYDDWPFWPDWDFLVNHIRKALAIAMISF
ncbi:hypothetical protein NUW58_g8971 [Xylaria curta]|uniref:Uncharacterized protein n=1 Tax=Xylaria curta TaxID=42375 RepID=A0ACC1N3T2_9PEZI|nr:hypothetical protein NUW58_g8971 [Xylaria curta]